MRVTTTPTLTPTKAVVVIPQNKFAVPPVPRGRGNTPFVQQPLSMDTAALPFVIPSEAEGSAVRGPFLEMFSTGTKLRGWTFCFLQPRSLRRLR
jgi:hypothetical protein